MCCCDVMSACRQAVSALFGASEIHLPCGGPNI